MPEEKGPTCNGCQIENMNYEEDWPVEFCIGIIPMAFCRVCFNGIVEGVLQSYGELDDEGSWHEGDGALFPPVSIHAIRQQFKDLGQISLKFRAAASYWSMQDRERAEECVSEGDKLWEELRYNEVDKLMPCCEDIGGKPPIQH